MSDESSVAPLDELVVVMAHDINNPLAALVTNLGFLEGALGPAVSADAAEALSDALMLCDVLRRLIGNLDLVARREGASGRSSLELGAAPKLVGVSAHGVDLALIARDAVTRMSKQAAAAEVELVFDSAVGSSDALVSCDRELLIRAFDNLIASAIERVPSRGRIVLTVTRGEREGRVVLRHPTRPEPTAFGTGPERAQRRRQIQATYGRGLTLHAARIAAALFGGRVEQGREVDGQTRLCLVAPGVEER
jgi:signal transduction histidine kinase